MDGHWIEEQALAFRQLSDLAAGRQQVMLYNAFRGVPIIHEAPILAVSSGFTILQVHPHQAACMILERCTHLRGNNLMEIYQASPVAVDMLHNEVVLTHLTPAGDGFGKRINLRVQSKEVVRVQIYTDEGAVMANMADISVNGVGIFTFGATLHEPIQMKRGRAVEMDLDLPTFSAPLRLHGKVLNIHHEDAAPLRRMGIQTLPSPEALVQLMDYINQRESEILEELQMTCDAMKKARTRPHYFPPSD